MFVCLGVTQFVYRADGTPVELDPAYVGHGLRLEKFPEGQLRVVSGDSVSLDYGYRSCGNSGEVLFQGTREALAVWNEDHNGW